MVDQYRPYSMPGVTMTGWLSGQPVIGMGRAQRVNEILITASLTAGGSSAVPPAGGASVAYSYPNLLFDMMTEFYLPAGYLGIPENQPFDGSTQQWSMYLPYNGLPNPTPVPPATSGPVYYSYPPALNFYDGNMIGIATDPANSSFVFGVNGVSRFGSVWMDKMLTDTDQAGNPAGIDLLGTTNLWTDPDQTNAAKYHPYSYQAGTNGNPGYYTGSVSATSARTTGILESFWDRSTARITGRPDATTQSGIGIPPRHIPRTLIRMRPPRPSGSKADYCTPRTTRATVPDWAPFPSSLRSTPWFRNGRTRYSGNFKEPTATYNAASIANVIAASIPVDITIAYPGKTQLLLRVADPMVNQLPGDWQFTTNPAATAVTMPGLTTPTATVYSNVTMDPYFQYQSANPYGGVNPTVNPSSFNGDNPGFRPSGGGDPLSIWLPNQDIRIPKQARLPSVGALFTGPHRRVCRSHARSRLDHGAARDTVPRDQHVALHAVEPGDLRWIELSGLGDARFVHRAVSASETLHERHRANPDAPSDLRRRDHRANEHQQSRRALSLFTHAGGRGSDASEKGNALRALFQGLTPSNQYATDTTPSFTTIDAPTSATLAQAITDYQAANGPFLHEWPDR